MCVRKQQARNTCGRAAVPVPHKPRTINLELSTRVLQELLKCLQLPRSRCELSDLICIMRHNVFARLTRRHFGGSCVKGVFFLEGGLSRLIPSLRFLSPLPFVLNSSLLRVCLDLHTYVERSVVRSVDMKLRNASPNVKCLTAEQTSLPFGIFQLERKISKIFTMLF